RVAGPQRYQFLVDTQAVLQPPLGGHVARLGAKHFVELRRGHQYAREEVEFEIDLAAVGQERQDRSGREVFFGRHGGALVGVRHGVPCLRQSGPNRPRGWNRGPARIISLAMSAANAGLRRLRALVKIQRFYARINLISWRRRLSYYPARH